MDGNGERRQGNLRFEPDTGLLVVGGRTAVLDSPRPDAVIGTYVELVMAQREVVPLTHVDLRNRELVQLSDLLELPQADLDALIDRELLRLLASEPGRVVPAVGAPAPDGGWSARRRLVAFGSLIVVAGGIAVATIAAQGSTVELPSTIATGAGSIEIIELEGGGTATRTESAPAAVGEDGTDVGTAVVLERNP